MPVPSRMKPAVRRSLPRAAVLTAAAVTVVAPLALSPQAVATAAIPDGNYSALVNTSPRFPSAPVAFSVSDQGTRIPRLTLYCHSDKTLYNGGAAADISITTGALSIRDGVVTDPGRQADVRPGGIYTVAAYAPLHLAIHHVDGPVVHYTMHGRRGALPTAWVGTVSSPACTTIADGGRVRAFGPVR